jgi:membrane-anchored protein YejM (alkaline phosphatase superfamily)
MYFKKKKLSKRKDSSKKRRVKKKLSALNFVAVLKSRNMYIYFNI